MTKQNYILYVSLLYQIDFYIISYLIPYIPCSNNVAVPTDFFKIIVAKQPGKNPEVGAFLVPNEPLHDAELPDLSVSISWLEKQYGIDLFKDLDKDVKNSEVTTLSIPFFPKKDRVRKMIHDSNSLTGLYSIWRNLTLEEKSELQPNYDEKKSRLENETVKQDIESNRV